MKRLVVVHDRDGRIVSVGQVAENSQSGLRLSLASGHTIVELDAECDLTQEALVDIHHHCRFDVRTRRLVLLREGELGGGADF